MWQAAANINFRAAKVPLTAHILIGAEVEPVGWAFANVSYEAGSADSPKSISQSLICLNPLKRWKVGFDGDLKSYDLRYTIAHEIGHAIGLDHPAVDGQIMGYRYEEQFRDLQPGDIAGAVLLYGGRQSQLTQSTIPIGIGLPSRTSEFARGKISDPQSSKNSRHQGSLPAVSPGFPRYSPPFSGDSFLSGNERRFRHD